MSRRQKWGVSAIFATGIFACICSVMRTVSCARLFGVEDLTYHVVDQALWAEGELSSAIVASCMISIPQFVRHVSPKVIGFTTLITSRRRKSRFSSTGNGPVPNTGAKHSDPVKSFPSNSSTLRSDYIELEEGDTALNPYKASAVKSMTTEVYYPRWRMSAVEPLGLKAEPLFIRSWCIKVVFYQTLAAQHWEAFCCRIKTEHWTTLLGDHSISWRGSTDKIEISITSQIDDCSNRWIKPKDWRELPCQLPLANGAMSSTKLANLLPSWRKQNSVTLIPKMQPQFVFTKGRRQRTLMHYFSLSISLT